MSDEGPAGAGGSAALARGDFVAARREFEAALGQADTAETRLWLARVCLVLEDLEEAWRQAEAAYLASRAAGELPGAAAAALVMAAVHEWSGEDAAVDGCLARARRLLEEADPCVEQGWLELARIGCDVADVVALEASALAALDIARRFGDTDLEVRALADLGLALVSQGRVSEGLSRLDEAMAAVVAGEVRSYTAAGTSCCAMLHACDRLGDMERARQWIDAVYRTARERFGDPPPVVLQSHCRLMYGTLLAHSGRWGEAEAEFRRTREGTRCLRYRADASGRLAELRIRQGRVAEAATLLAGFEDCVDAAPALARLSLARGETDVAAATLRRALRDRASDLLARAPLLALLVEVEISRGDPEAAVGASEELVRITQVCDVALTRALCALSRGRLAAATGADASEHLQAALEHLPQGQWPVLRADMQLELAVALRDRDRGAAVAEARAALAAFERIDARQQAGRAAALLRELGVSARLRSDEPPPSRLSRREREVLELLGEGLSNAQIARRLFITTKTAEHHVCAVLGKLGVRTRAEAAVLAAARRAGPQEAPLTSLPA